MVAFEETLWGLFGEVSPLVHQLEKDTYIYDALQPRVTRWADEAFALRVCALPAVGVLLSPTEVRLLTDCVRRSLAQLQSVWPERLQFSWVNHPGLAHWVIRYHRGKQSPRLHCVPSSGPDGQLEHADIHLALPPTDLQAAAIESELLHQGLHALGIAGHSHHYQDMGVAEPGKAAPTLSPRDRLTLGLLYRLPVGLLAEDLQLLWQVFEESGLHRPAGRHLQVVPHHWGASKPMADSTPILPVPRQPAARPASRVRAAPVMAEEVAQALGHIRARRAAT